MDKYNNRFGKAALTAAALTFLCGVAAIAGEVNVAQSVNHSAAASPDGVSWQAARTE